MRNKRLVYRIVAHVWLILCLVTALACHQNVEQKSNGRENDSDIRKANILAIVSELRTIPFEKDEPLNEAAKNSLRQLVGRLVSPKDIATLARICRAFVIHDWPSDGKSDSELEVLYDEAYWQCVRALATKPTEEMRQQLQRLRETSSLNDTESGYFSSIVEGKPFP